ncbi:hypothetical protein SAMN06265348_103225 [Pedobacter westerhofensis]|uniref:SD-repeat containing protein B domain-containing protein n=1 Tax=Pedobacter westerhofensis TaxID=425512 RepID=A0A521C4U7_9SPHI|nr:hypothetical protein SAMN06265348_103225 [Pedobacter westerhofensis]
MINLPDSIILEPKEFKTFPVKYIADRRTIYSNLQEFKVKLITKSPGIIIQSNTRFFTHLSDASSLTIGTDAEEIYLDPLTNQVQLAVNVTNNGFMPVSFHLILTGAPEGLELTGQMNSLVLQPGGQQLFPFLVRNKIGNKINPDFTVTIQAVDEVGNQLSLKIIRVINVTSARRLGNGQFGGNLPNTIALRYGSFTSKSYFYQLQGYGKMKTGNDESLEYHFNGEQYYQQDYKGINISDTYLDYQSRHWGLKIGNVYENIDFQMGGKGVKASGKLSKGGVISILGIQNNYLLYDQAGNTRPGAKIYAVDYLNQIAGTAGRRFTVLHSQDSYTGLNASQLSLKNAFKVADGRSLVMEAGISKEDQATGGKGSKQGYAGGIIYAALTENFQLNATQYYSSAFFTGLRRGQLLSDVRLLRKLGAHNSLSAHLTIQLNDPKYQSDLVNLSDMLNLGINKNQLYIYDLGYIFRTRGISFGINPYYMEQRLIAGGSAQMDAFQTDWKARSVRFSTHTEYNGRIQSFTLSADYGYTYLNTSGRPRAPFHSLKINTSYTLPILGFSGYVQLNPFYLSDALTSFSESNKYTIYSGGPNVHFSAFKKSFNIQAGGMYNYYGFAGNSNYSASVNMRYILTGHWALTADMQYAVTKQKFLVPFATQDLNIVNAFRDQRYNSRQMRFGIEKQFGKPPGSSAKKLDLTYYDDINSNGERDAGELPVGGVLIKIENGTAVTNNKGQVRFMNMEQKAYIISIASTRGWSLQHPTEIFMNKNKKLDIPLVKAEALYGCVKLASEKYLEGKPALSGIKITAMDSNGLIHVALTDDKGKFCFYLPRNHYTIYIETEGLPFSIENGKEEVSLQGLPVKMLTFIYKDQRRKVEVKHF